MIPYRIRSHSVSVSRSRGGAPGASVLASLVTRFSDLLPSLNRFNRRILREPGPSRKRNISAALAARPCYRSAVHLSFRSGPANPLDLWSEYLLVHGFVESRQRLRRSRSLIN